MNKIGSRWKLIKNLAGLPLNSIWEIENIDTSRGEDPLTISYDCRRVGSDEMCRVALWPEYWEYLGEFSKSHQFKVIYEILNSEG